MITFQKLTAAQYATIEEKVVDRFYFLTDSGEMYLNGRKYGGGGGGGSVSWGDILGTLSNQADLAEALAAKADLMPNVTTIAADAATPYALLDASATTNSHSYHYVHAPSTSPIYTLPDVSSTTTVQHEIVLTVTFSATALSVAFQTTGGTTVPLDKEITPAAGDVWTFLCRYVASSWRIYPIKEA